VRENRDKAYMVRWWHHLQQIERDMVTCKCDISNFEM